MTSQELGSNGVIHQDFNTSCPLSDTQWGFRSSLSSLHPVPLETHYKEDGGEPTKSFRMHWIWECRGGNP